MTYPRVQARRRQHLLVTAWPSQAFADTGGYALRVSGGCLSATGGIIQITDANGYQYDYTPFLTSGVEIVERLDLSPDSIRISLYPSLHPGHVPRDYDFDQGIAEIAQVNEDATGAAIEQTWATRRARLAGSIEDFRFGDRDEPVSFGIDQNALMDYGLIFGESLLLTTNRFPDLASTDERARANNSTNLAPPMPIGPSDSNCLLFSPMPIVVDEVDADPDPMTPVDLSYRRFLLTYETMFDTATVRDVKWRDPRIEGRLTTGSAYDGALSTGVDALNDTYTYMEGNFRFAFGSNTVTTNGTATVTATRLKPAQQLDQFLFVDTGTPDGDEFWEVIDEIVGSTITLEAAYAGTTGSNQTAQVIQLPADVAYPAFVDICGGGGGIINLRGNAPLSSPADVIEFFLLRSVMTYRPDLAMVRDQLARVAGWLVTHVVTSNAAPFAYLQEHFLSWLPLRPYLSDGAVRFLWEGPIDAQEVLTTIDLSARDSGMVRISDVTHTPIEDVFNEVKVQYRYEIYRERYTRSLTATGKRPDVVGAAPVIFGHARALSSQYTYDSGEACAPAPRRLPEPLSIDAISDEVTAGLAANHFLYRFSRTRPRMTIAGLPFWGWLEIGDVVRVTEDDTVPDCQAWRIMQKTTNGFGDVTFEIEGLPDIIGPCDQDTTITDPFNGNNGWIVVPGLVGTTTFASGLLTMTCPSGSETKFDGVNGYNGPSVLRAHGQPAGNVFVYFRIDSVTTESGTNIGIGLRNTDGSSRLSCLYSSSAGFPRVFAHNNTTSTNLAMSGLAAILNNGTGYIGVAWVGTNLLFIYGTGTTTTPPTTWTTLHTLGVSTTQYPQVFLYLRHVVAPPVATVVGSFDDFRAIPYAS